MDYMENWGSIESTFISDGRMLRERGMSGLWQPNWYLGTRFDYVYPPALRYGTAVLSQLLNVSTARSYHLYTATLYCLGFVGIYWLVRVGSGWRGWAWVAALATSVLSPTFLFIDAFYQDALPARLMPVRLGVLIRYGEGPHMSALALLGFALAAAWWGLRSGHVRALVLTAFSPRWWSRTISTAPPRSRSSSRFSCGPSPSPNVTPGCSRAEPPSARWPTA
jgi:hypothetical protein